MKTKKLTVMDFFCGCGGLSLGFLQAGYNVTLGLDNDLMSLETFKKNHPGSNAKNIDLHDFEHLENIFAENSIEYTDVIIGGPPCQGFSLTGSRNFDDKRNSLYLTMIKSVKILKPKALLLENVTGLSTLYDGQVKNEIIKRLEREGYNVSFKILCAADYGVPQIRKRVFFVGLRKELGIFEFPEPTHSLLNYVTCEDAISDLPSRENELGNEQGVYTNNPLTSYQEKMRGKNSILNNHVATAHKDFVKDVISLVPDGGNYKDLPRGVGEHRKFNEAWTRYSSNKPSRTIDTGHRNHFHYKWNRVPTIRENARLQSFPDDFVFVGSKTQQNRQVGNAVPPLLGFHIAQQLKKYIK